ncbi:MAG: holo-[acyl-carrier protein] synthase [Candidatus Dependentiae bacterium]|nr:holo-[acyl-carrier protein] synthase [Candidatus Dependentiae bacterium]
MIGIDLVYIPRFTRWLSYSDNQLLTIFSCRELEECRRRTPKEAEFLASRFAVKEAFYKALSTTCATITHIQPFGLRTIARFVEITPDARWGCPLLLFSAQEFYTATGIRLPTLTAQISLSHDHDYAIAQVVITLV